MAGDSPVHVGEDWGVERLPLSLVLPTTAFTPGPATVCSPPVTFVKHPELSRWAGFMGIGSLPSHGAPTFLLGLTLRCCHLEIPQNC